MNTFSSQHHQKITGWIYLSLFLLQTPSKGAGADLSQIAVAL
jgi:hypothetical protein